MGNVIIGQSGGPTAVINAALAGAIKAGIQAGIEKVYGMHHGIAGFLREDLVNMYDYISTEMDLSLLKRTPAAFLGTCRYKLPDYKEDPEDYEKIFQLMEKYDIEYFLYIGGNDSMDTVDKLRNYAEDNGRKEKFIGIPKTIDNDLPITDHCPGFGSAAKYIAITMKELIRDNESYGYTNPSILVVEIMGRNAGWLTAASALSKDLDCIGPDLIYVPEVDFNLDQFLDTVQTKMKHQDSLSIAVSEGAHLADGTLVCELDQSDRAVDAFGHIQLSGTSQVLGDMIKNKMGFKTRSIEFSTIQRCAAHIASRTDLDESFSCGYVGCQAALDGETGKMVTIDVKTREPYVVNYSLHDVKEIANLEKKLPLDWVGDDGVSIKQEFIDYCRPLIKDSINPYYYNGITRHMILANSKKSGKY